MSRKPPAFHSHPIDYVDSRERGLVRAVCQHVVDGDTADFFLDLGWHQYAYFPLRLAGIDAPETRGTSGEEHQRAVRARERLQELIFHVPCLVRSYAERRSFERYIADVWFHDDGAHGSVRKGRLTVAGTRWVSAQQVLLAEGLADPFPTN